MTRSDCDIFISGAGIAGLVAGAALASRGLRVVIADPSPPPETASEELADLRTTALLAPSVRLLEDIGVWQRLAPFATPLKALRVVNCEGDPPAVRTEREFTPGELGLDTFGWNLPNWRVRSELASLASGEANIDLRFGAGFSSLLARDTELRVRLSDGSRLSARLGLAADGHASPMREAAGLRVRAFRYGQAAMAFTAVHEMPHGNVSSEFYLHGGAFTTVPVADIDGQPASAVVWMNDGAKTLRLGALDDAAFGAAATLRTARYLGEIRPVTARQTWPVLTQWAEGMTARRVALLAEAAHVLPPIGAQGLNTSLRDVAGLLDALPEEPADIGNEAMLRTYERRRRTDVAARARVIDLYNRLCMSGDGMLSAARSLGLTAAHDIGPLRRSIMRAGLGL